ncbi:M20/M25/M40 family metallo-hydrolase [Neobacillus sp. D3-1R]|uniref:M20/M25/M40 family metallo-hydrolase n=1 Tax=Neobacillus sp. D3-1R TaxID=3445778 RepID=UPI003F9F5E27
MGIQLKKQIIANLPAYLKELIDFVKVPNNVFNLDQVVENANFLIEIMKKRGIKVEVIPTKTGRPLIYGELFKNPSNKNILIYGHYDGVPVEADKWNSDPYQPIFRRSEGGGLDFNDDEDYLTGEWRVYGRSIADSKNAIIAILLSLDLLEEKEILPGVNIKFLFDGEEEIESPSLEECLTANPDMWKADLMISASGEVHQSGLPTVELGVRGMLQVDITTYTSVMNLHSGHFGNFAPNAALDLSYLLSSMKDRSGKVCVKGFYDEVQELTDSELKVMDCIPAIEAEICQNFGIMEPEMKGLSLQRMINLPTLNIRGLAGGFLGEEARNIIPSNASAELDIRLVKGMNPEVTFEKIKQHIIDLGWTVLEKDPSREEMLKFRKIVKMTKKAGFSATKTNLDSKEAQHVINVLKQLYKDQMVVMPTEGGSLPLYLFERLGIPVVCLPTSNYDCNQHTNNENLRIDHFVRAIELFTTLFMKEME